MVNPDLQIRDGAPSHPNPEKAGVGGGEGSGLKINHCFFLPSGLSRRISGLFAGYTCLRSPEKSEKNNACSVGYHSLAEVKVGIYEKKCPKARREGLVC